MRIREFARDDAQSQQIAAIAKFLTSRAQDTDSEKRISTRAFIKLANDMGISLTTDQLKSMATRPPLDSMIANVEGDDITGTVTFKGAEEEVTQQMSVDQARDTVDKMAKRAVDIK